MNSSKILVPTSFLFVLNRKPLSRNHLQAIPRRGFSFCSPSLSSVSFHSLRKRRSFHSYRCSHYLPELDSESVEDLDTVETLLAEPARVQKLMKMERRRDPNEGEIVERWFPYHNRCLCRSESESLSLESNEVIEALENYILDVRKEKMKRIVANRSYSISLVVEGLTDFGNVSAAFRSADALGIQSAHVISGDNKQRCFHTHWGDKPSLTSHTVFAIYSENEFQLI